MAFCDSPCGSAILVTSAHEHGTRSLDLLPFDQADPAYGSSSARSRADAAVQLYVSAPHLPLVRITAIKTLSTGQVLLGYSASSPPPRPR